MAVGEDHLSPLRQSGSHSNSHPTLWLQASLYPSAHGVKGETCRFLQVPAGFSWSCADLCDCRAEPAGEKFPSLCFLTLG